MALREYRRKRNFSKTPEPSGTTENTKKEALHFVVHKHQASRLHWDLRLELDGVLKSWAIPKGPSLDPQQKKLAVMVEDHPIDYQYFEGIIPEGNYGAGQVMIWDKGTYHDYDNKDRKSTEETIRNGIEKGHITFILEGQRLKGEFALVRLKKGKENDWLLVKKKDAFATADPPPDDNSVSSGRTMEEIARGKSAIEAIDLSDAPKGVLPARVRPMLATLISGPFDRAGWLFEIKWDGFRCITEAASGDVRLYSRNGKSLNQVFPAVVEALSSFSAEAVLDGEVVVIDTVGRSNFQMLQNYLVSHSGSLVYYVFDILFANGHDLTPLPLVRRKEILRRVVPDSPVVRFSDYVETEGVSLFDAAVENELEGIIAKDSNSPYRPGQRSKEWLKIKTHQRQEAIITGFTQPKEGRKDLGSLLLGVYDDGELSFVGHAGTGFSDKTIHSLRSLLEKYSRATSPFTRQPRITTPVKWVEPKIVCEIQFTEWTRDGLMRHPVFIGVREDRNAKDVTREIPMAAPQPFRKDPDKTIRTTEDKNRANLAAINDSKVKLTRLNKILWPEEGWTKSDLIDYYRRVAPYILPYLNNRPESLHRFPDGITGASFFQKDMRTAAPPWAETIAIPSEEGRKTIRYLLCQDEATLIYMANLGCIEINPWHSTVTHIDYPDYLVLDLDPLDVPFSWVIEAAEVTHHVLTEIGAIGFCKTSGATGLHIFVPLGAKYTYDQSSQFARLINLLVHSRLPERTSTERRPEKRQNKVYLDHLQNRRAQTVVAPYSVRPVQGATVSAPLKWEELQRDLNPKEYTIRTILPRIEELGDLFQGILGKGVDMDKSLARLDDILKA